MRTNAEVKLWGKTIGAVSLQDSEKIAEFEYDSEFIQTGIQLAPITMPLKKGIYRFPELSYETYQGLPGLVADSLPDKFGNSLIDLWLAKQGRLPESFNSVEKLCYIGNRGMGALEYHPVLMSSDNNEKVIVSELVELASMVLQNRKKLQTVFDISDKQKLSKSLAQIISIGSSAGGARAKAVIDLNPSTNEIRSGQLDNGKDFESWIIKFSGVNGNKDKENEDISCYGKIEYAYYLMAKEAGINMMDCKLLDEEEYSHFMTKRFDRDDNGKKKHVQTLCGLAHFDFNRAGVYSYEQLFSILLKLGCHHSECVEAFRRMVFNVFAYNCDDHTKNISFIMDRTGQWTLSPAYDISFAFNPGGQWTFGHQMTINGKRTGITENDFEACARLGNLKNKEIQQCISDVKSSIAKWKTFSNDAKIPDEIRDSIWSEIKMGL